MKSVSSPCRRSRTATWRCWGSAGNLYIADLGNSRIREVAAGTGIITTVAGNNTSGYSGDGEAATSAELNRPYGVAVDRAGNLYIADLSNNRIREVTASTGIITTVAGNGTFGYNGDGGAAASAELSSPTGVAVDSAGNLYIADSGNNRVREVAVGTGIITTVVGNGTEGYNGDGGLATSAELNDPAGVAVDSAGNLYISDTDNVVIRKVTASTGIINTVADNGTDSYSGDGGAATSAALSYPLGLALDNVGNLYFADANNNVVREVEVTTASTLIFPTATKMGSTDTTDGP
jgi:trimeric autotransporter adhesin